MRLGKDRTKEKLLMIFVDANEIATSKIPEILKSLNVPTLTVANQGPDYIIDNVVAVERKTASDYMQSKTSGHLDKQLYEMSTNFDLSYLIIYGDMLKVMFDHGYPRPMYYSSLIGSTLKRSNDGKQGQIITINDTSIFCDEDLASFLFCLHKKIIDGDFVRVPKMERFEAKNVDYQKRLFMTFPNIGEKRAEEILKTYKSPQSALSILFYQSHSFNIKGVSRETVKRINEILTAKYEDY